MPYIRQVEGWRAWRRRFKRRSFHLLILTAVILVATVILNFFFSFSDYMPVIYEPKDFEREEMLKKLEQAPDKPPEKSQRR